VPPTGQVTSWARTIRRAGHRARGLTLIQVMLCIVITGVAVLALVSAQAAFHKKNFWASHLSTATYLAGEIREATWYLPQRDPVTGDANWGAEIDNELTVADYDDLDDFDGNGGGLIFSAEDGTGPINARREVIPNMAGWSQWVYVFNVAPDNISINPETLNGEIGDSNSDVMGVQVTVKYQGVNDPDPVTMTSVSWIAPR
jgi:hypothetical protein